MENANLISVNYSSECYKQLESHLIKTVLRSEVRPHALELNAQKDNNSEPFRLIFKQVKKGADTYSVPITYQRQQIGVLQLFSQEKASHESDKVNRLIKHIAYLVSRYMVAELSQHYLGKRLMITGESPTTLDIDRLIEKTSYALYPVIIVGEQGTEKSAVAAAIHFNSRNKHGAFVEIDCSYTSNSEFRSNLETRICGINQGTLFLNGIDLLDAQQQATLLTSLSSYSDGVESGGQKSRRNFSIIATSAKNIEELSLEGNFSRLLYEELSFLEISFPPLRERVEDIPALLNLLLKRFKLFEEQSLSVEVIEALQGYHWPGNEKQLQKAVARLLTFSDNNPITMSDLQMCLPELFSEPLRCNKAGIIQMDNLTRQMLNNELSLYSGMHSGLYKALQYIATHYEREITLSELSCNVYVSASHLSYLFKHHLNKSFKQVLAELRIERAKQKMTQAPFARITDIFQEVGYGDLSHFEKMFKRHTGVTPREYKKKIQSMYQG